MDYQRIIFAFLLIVLHLNRSCSNEFDRIDQLHLNTTAPKLDLVRLGYLFGLAADYLDFPFSSLAPKQLRAKLNFSRIEQLSRNAIILDRISLDYRSAGQLLKERKKERQTDRQTERSDAIDNGTLQR